MFDHRYLSEMSKALHIFRDFSFLACAVLTFIRILAAAQTTREVAGEPRIQPRFQRNFRDRTGH
ncbi:MAG: hypothetical protein ACLQHF_02750 [Terracidiphilus sp.]